jgi:hypothetical protein
VTKFISIEYHTVFKNSKIIHVLTFLPASLLCKFINTRFIFLLFRRRSLASTNFWEKAVPKAILSEHPDHSKPSELRPLTVLSHPQCSRSPLLQARVTAWATPAADIACTKATSRVPEENKTKNIYFDIYLLHLSVKSVRFLLLQYYLFTYTSSSHGAKSYVWNSRLLIFGRIFVGLKTYCIITCPMIIGRLLNIISLQPNEVKSGWMKITLLYVWAIWKEKNKN